MLPLICLLAAPTSNRQVTFVHFLSGGKQLIIALADFTSAGKSLGKLGIWDIRTGKCVRLIPGTKGEDLSQATLSLDGRLIATGGRDQEPVVVRDVASGRVVRRFEAGLNAYPKYAFLPDGKTIVLLASAQFTEYGHLEAETCTLPDGKPEKLISSDGASRIAIDPYGKYVAVQTRTVVGSMNTFPQSISYGLFIYDAKTHALTQSLPARGHVANMGFSSDGKRFAARRGTGKIDLIDTETWQVKRSLFSQSSPDSFGFDESPMLFSGDGRTLVVGLDGLGVSTYDLAHGGTQRTIYASPRVIWRSIDISPDGNTLAAGTTDGKVELRSLREGHIVKNLSINL